MQSVHLRPRLLGLAALFVLSSLFCHNVLAADAEAAAYRWSLYDEAQRSFDELQQAIDYGCERLRKAPPSVTNAQVRVLQCGAQANSELTSRQIKIHYTLKIKNMSLDQESLSKNTFSILRKPYCPSSSHPYLQEENESLFRYSCWRCPMSDVAARPPRFLSAQKVRWYRNNLCPVDYDLTKPVELQVLAGMTITTPQALPKAFGFGDYDASSLYVLRDTSYGQVLLLHLPTGQQILFVGDGVDNTLHSENDKAGQLQWLNNTWVWKANNRTEYQFALQAENVYKAVNKKIPDGRRWQFRWQTFTLANMINDWRMEQVVDPAKQQYLFQYSKQGKLMGMAVQGAKANAGQRLAQAKN